LKLNIGTPKAAVAAAFGKRFGLFKVVSDDDNGKIGVPTGLWDVYHLTAPPDRMYVTIVHFGIPPTSSASVEVVDALMLMPAGTSTVSQILKDQPAFASICKAACDLVLVRNKAGNRSLLLRPKDPHANTVLYFDGDGAGKWKSVTSVDAVVSWAYALSRSEFEAHRKPIDDEVIGVWSPETSSAR
jgi:hypothetical protein